ncbi:hypothetical protein ACFQZX_00050 [Mucilaginibacter litoreus]|uniref:Membrane protein involved in the export of O-antigen and teichoic acid n=1 Tax=Mucilaginibacter litoreus TaxID=1048221 RepID=A0ABW3ALT5_9SPHI
MSIAKRLINGSLASWFQIIITVLTQVLLVPVYLLSWDVETYGLWLAIQALSILFITLDTGHQTYLNFEFLRIGQNNPKKVSLYLWSGVWVGFGVGILQVLLILIIVFTNLLGLLLNEAQGLSSSLIQSAGLVLIIQSVSNCLCLSGGGVINRVLGTFGYYPRTAWWTAGAMAVAAIAPAIAVAYGANLLEAAIVRTVVCGIYYALQYIDFFYLLHKNKIRISKGSLRLGWKNFLKSIHISAKSILENARNVGVRVILAPLTGAVNLVAFSTLRTGANFAMQGLNTITNPLMPELMHFLNKRDQERSETALGTIWIIIVAIMSPGVVALQTFIEPLFNLWTRGKVVFNPMLFAVLSLSVLVFAIAQPAIAIVTGNNLLRVQLKISAIAALIVLVGMIVLVPRIGLLGAGLVLLAAEIVTCVSYISAAKAWLHNNQLIWPRQASYIANRSVFIAAVGMGLIIMLKHDKYILLAVILFMLLLNLYDYWRTMPFFARFRTKQMFRSLSVFRK